MSTTAPDRESILSQEAEKPVCVVHQIDGVTDCHPADDVMTPDEDGDCLRWSGEYILSAWGASLDSPVSHREQPR